SISQQRDVVTVYVGDARYQLEEIPAVLAKTNQALTTLDTYRARLEQVSTRLTALEFQSAVMLDDVLTAMQRAEMTTRMVDEIERNVVDHVVDHFNGLEAFVRASVEDLEEVDSVGSVRAREIREGLRRLQEQNLVDRYLNL